MIQSKVLSVCLPVENRDAIRRSLEDACLRLGCTMRDWPEESLLGSCAFLFVEPDEGGDGALLGKAKDETTAAGLPFVRILSSVAVRPQWLCEILSPYCSLGDAVVSRLLQSDSDADRDRIVPSDSPVPEIITETPQTEVSVGTKKQPRKVAAGWVYFLAALSAVLLFFLGRSLVELSDDEQLIGRLSARLDTKQGELDKMKADLASREGILNEAKAWSPILVKDVRVGNISKDGSIESDYGKTIYASDAMYLSPEVTYLSFTDTQDSLYVKLYRPDRSTPMSNSSSPRGFTYSFPVTLEEGKNASVRMSGWGYEEKGYYEAGEYRVEIWTKDHLLYVKLFTLF